MMTQSTEYPRSATLGQFTVRLSQPELTALRAHAFANVSVYILPDTRCLIAFFVCLFRRRQIGAADRMNYPGCNECRGGAHQHDL